MDDTQTEAAFYELSRANIMQFAINKKLEYCTTTVCTFLNQRAIQAVWLYSHINVQLHISSGCKRKSDFVRINTDVSCLLNLNVQFQKTFTSNTHSWPFLRNAKASGQGGLIKKKTCGYESFLEENNA